MLEFEALATYADNSRGLADGGSLEAEAAHGLMHASVMMTSSADSEEA